MDTPSRRMRRAVAKSSTDDGRTAGSWHDATPERSSVDQSGYSLSSTSSARFPARLACATVSKNISERSIGLVLPARYISHLHDFGGGALFFTTTEKSV